MNAISAEKKTIYYISTEDGVCWLKTLRESNTLRLRNKKGNSYAYFPKVQQFAREKLFNGGR